MLKEIIILGIGGDGVQLTGFFLMEAALLKKLNLSFYPIYGSQMRGGESTLVVKISDQEIVNPVLSKPDIVAITNDTFKNKYKKYINGIVEIDISKNKIFKNKNIVLLAKIVKELKIFDKEDFYILFQKKFKKEEVFNTVKSVFDIECNR